MFFEKPDVSGWAPAVSGEASTLSEVAADSWAVSGLFGEYVTRMGYEERAIDERNDAIKTAVGIQLENPYRVRQRAEMTNEQWAALAPYSAADVPQYHQRLRELADKYPHAVHVIRPDDPIQKQAGQLFQDASERAASSLERSPWSTHELPLFGRMNPAALSTGFVSGMTDPFIIATLPLAGGRAGVGAAEVGWHAVKMAGANALGTALEQPFIKQWSHEAGLDYTWNDAGHAVAGAAAFGMLAEVGIRGGSRATNRVAGRVPVLDAEGKVTGWRRADPRADPIAALDEAAAARPPTDDLRRAAEGDPDALRRVAREAGVADQPAMRGALAAAEADHLMRAPDGIEPHEHAGRLHDAARAAADPEALPPGDAVLVPKGEPVEGPRLAEMLGRHPIEIAAELRDNPALLDEGFPWADGRLRPAVMLSRLSEPAFERVAAREARPEIAALVAEHVADAGRHVELIDKLQAANPRDLPQARARLAELMVAPRSPEAHAMVAGVEPREPRVHLVDDPHGADAKRQLEQLRRDHAAEIEAATGEKPEGAPDRSAPLMSMVDPEQRLPEPTPTTELPGYGTPEFEASRQFKYDGADVVGYPAAVDHLAAVASRFAGDYGVAFQRQATILVGPPGAGKSTVGKGVARHTRSALVTADDAKLWIPEFDGGRGSAAVHEESSRLAGMVQDKLLATDANIVLEKLGGNPASIIGLAGKLKDNGYDVRLIAVGAGRELLLRRIEERARKTGRFVPVEQLDAALASISSTIENASKSDKFSGVVQIDNSGERPYITGGREVYGNDLEAAIQGPLRQSGVGAGNRGPADPGGVGAPRGREGQGSAAAGSDVSGRDGAHKDLAAAIDEAQRKLPLGVTVKSFADLAEIPKTYADAIRSSGLTVDALTERRTGNIWIAKAALNPGGTLAHETVHSLRERGLLTDPELKLLSERADKVPGLWDRTAYEEAYKDHANPAESLMQEAAAHLYEARSKGADFGAKVNGILDRIREFFDRVRNSLNGLGFRTADDVMRAIDSGEIGRRTPSAEAARQVPGHHFSDGTLFALRSDARDMLRQDLEAAKAMADEKAKAQKERQALIDEGVRKTNERFVTTFRDARGQVDPAKAMMRLIESHGETDLPAGMTSVAAEAKAVEGMAKAGMEEALHTFRPQFGTGKTRNMARLTNIVREMSGEKTGDAAAVGLSQAWLKTAERLRQEFNAAGGDIAKLEGWFLPQVHDRAALLKAGSARWLADIWRGLDLERIRDGETGQPLSHGEIRAALKDIWQNITSDGSGTLAANAANPFGGISGDATGARKLANQRQEHRFLHFKSADAWLDYQKNYGGGADPFRAMMQHITSMSKDIAAMRVLGTNPERELARLANFATKQARLMRPTAQLIEEAVGKVKDLNAQMLKRPQRLDAIADRIGEILGELWRLRQTPGAKAIQPLREEYMRLEKERGHILDGRDAYVDGIVAAWTRVKLDEAHVELTSIQDADRALFPSRTEIFGKQMKRDGWLTTDPEDYARSAIYRTRQMWDVFRGAASAPVNMKFAETMQSARNLGVVGRGGSMVISSLADNFAQVMARGFVGTPMYKTFTDILKQFGPESRREGHRQALIGESYLHMYNDGARNAAGTHGAEWTHYLAERTIALQGLGALTDAQRQGFGMSLQAALADMTHVSLNELEAANPRLGRLWKRYGLDAATWDAIRLDPATGKPLQVDFLSPNAVRDSLEAAGRGGERIAERYLGMILQESDFASPTSMLRTRALMAFGTRPGTLGGELIRTGGQFKSFAVMWWMLHVERAAREMVMHGALRGAGYAAQIATVMTLGGALVVQLKDLKGGKDPQPMDDPKFWGRAVVQGGGLGIMGDLLASETNRFGGGLVSTVGGPVVGMAEDVIRPFADQVKSKQPNPGRHVAKLATSYVPGSSLWYTNLLWKRMIADQVQKMLDPEAYKAFAKQVHDQQHDVGNEFWWSPGETGPRRGPRFDRLTR